MNGLLISATFSPIEDANRDAFKEVIRGLVKSSKDEAGVHQYEWFFSDDEAQCVLQERYESSEVVLARMPRHGPQVARLVELSGGLDVRVFGEPSEELRAALATMAPTMYHFFDGM